MENRSIKIKSSSNNKLSISVIPGHFATSHSHINYYIDMTKIKHRLSVAREAGKALSSAYAHNVAVDTIICMDECEIVGGFMAYELTKPSLGHINSDAEINIVTPTINANNQMIFVDNLQNFIWNKRVILLVASATTGKTISRALECIKYYGGEVVGISAIFSAIEEKRGLKVNSLFTTNDIPGYENYSHKECPMCNDGKKLDAIVSSMGYTKL